MKLDKLHHNPPALLDFFDQGLGALGAVCERTWHDRLQLVAEDRAATLWNPQGALLETELHFVAADQTGPRDAAREVFPGCPLTFRLTEMLCAPPLLLERAVLSVAGGDRPPAREVGEKLWHQQFPDASRWRLESDWRRAWHFSLLALVRSEVQAIDQHWSLHRVAVSVMDGERDEALAGELDFAQLDAAVTAAPPWPAADPSAWQPLLHRALVEETAPLLAPIRDRQESYLRRELKRVDEYFDGYERELRERAARSSNEKAKARFNERLAAARAEHARRRDDQVQRHEIRVVPHLDALLLLAEPAWGAEVGSLKHHELRRESALLVPRARRWVLSTTGETRAV
jgi:hypothetical protein